MPLFTSLPSPVLLTDPEISTGGHFVMTANNAYFVPIPPVMAPCTVTSLRCRWNPGGGHFDMGIYSDNAGTPGTLLGHCASTATSLTTVTGIMTQSLLSGNLTIGAGRYWLAMWLDSATDKPYIYTPVPGITNCLTGPNGSNPLPTLASSLTLVYSGFKPVIQALVVGGWA